jgi:hypothetical protein
MKDNKIIKIYSEYIIENKNINLHNFITRLTNLPKHGLSIGPNKGEYIKWEDLEKVIIDMMEN